MLQLTPVSESFKKFPYKAIHFTACKTLPEALVMQEMLIKRYHQTPVEEADVVVVLGGDGFMLKTLHQLLHLQKPFYGINYGSVGFLMNAPCGVETLIERLDGSQPTLVNLLRMQATTMDGVQEERLAFNEISLLRQTYQTAKLKVTINHKVRLAELVCDGMLISTPAGSTAYNFSAHGPILPLGSKLLALTPLSAFRPRRWRGAVLPHNVVIEIHVLAPQKRPVSATADDQEVRNIQHVRIVEDHDVGVTLLFDSQDNLDERILTEQFYPI